MGIVVSMLLNDSIVNSLKVVCFGRMCSGFMLSSLIMNIVGSRKNMYCCGYLISVCISRMLISVKLNMCMFDCGVCIVCMNYVMSVMVSILSLMRLDFVSRLMKMLCELFVILMLLSVCISVNWCDGNLF